MHLVSWEAAASALVSRWSVAPVSLSAQLSYDDLLIQSARRRTTPCVMPQIVQPSPSLSPRPDNLIFHTTLGPMEGKNHTRAAGLSVSGGQLALPGAISTIVGGRDASRTARSRVGHASMTRKTLPTDRATDEDRRSKQKETLTVMLLALRRISDPFTNHN